MDATSNLLISADSHVIEPADLWAKRLPRSFRDQAPRYKEKTVFQAQEGGTDPVARVKEMAMDGVSGEILYPSLAMDQFGLPDAALQEACFRVYNDWLVEYCAHAPDRLFGVAPICTYRIDNAVKEVHRCKDAGMRGLMIWQVPPEDLLFTSDHYERFWATAEELEMPVSLHILTGVAYAPGVVGQEGRNAPLRLSFTVNKKLLYVTDALIHIIASGVLERFPRLKIVLVETEVSWLPFVLSQWDKYCARGIYDTTMTMAPSEYFRRQCYATFFNDPPARSMFHEWGAYNCMWSNDFPHRNSTWPKSREVIRRDLGALPETTRTKLLHENVTRLFDLPAITPLAELSASN